MVIKSSNISNQKKESERRRTEEKEGEDAIACGAIEREKEVMQKQAGGGHKGTKEGPTGVAEKKEKRDDK